MTPFPEMTRSMRLEISLYWKTGAWVYINPGEINWRPKRLKLRLRTIVSKEITTITNIMIITRSSICFSPNGAWGDEVGLLFTPVLPPGVGGRRRSQARPYHTFHLRLFIIPSLWKTIRLLLKSLLLSCILFSALGKGSSVIHLHSAILPRNANFNYFSRWVCHAHT